LALALPLLSFGAQAAESGERRLTVGGFGTLGALYHDSEGLEYRRSLNQSKGAEAGKVDFAVDTLAGLQLNGAWNRELESVIQVVSRYDTGESWRPRLTRGFIRYAPNESLMFRAGRVGYELLPRTDSRDVGYSYLSIRAPVEVFGILPRDHFDGADVTLTHPLAMGLARIKLYGGTATGTVVYHDRRVDLDGSKVWGGHVEYIGRDWGLRLGRGVFLAGDEANVDPLIAGLRAAATPQAMALADDLAEKDRHTQFTVGAITYDHDPLQARLFVSYAQSDNPVRPNGLLAALTLGYDLGQVTPFIGYALAEPHGEIQGTGRPDATPRLAAFNAAVFDAQTRARPEQSTLTLGLRYDFAPRMDLKLQVDRVWRERSSLVLDRNNPPDHDADMLVFGVALDFIF